LQSGGTLGGPQEELMAQNLKLANTTTATYRTYKRKKDKGRFFKEWSKKGPPQQMCRTKN
jgi:hypothetical protein